MAARLLALGVPFCVGGDWQVSPSQVAESGLADFLGATVVSPGTRANTQSGSEIDFFLISNTLLAHGFCISASTQCPFEPHLPVVLDLHFAKGARKEVRRISQPRLLPVYRVIGPLPIPNITIDWAHWKAGEAAKSLDKPNEETLTNAAVTWAAGAEVELLAALGITGDDEVHHMGIGMEPRFVVSPAGQRFRDVPDVLGLTGHWMMWAARGFKIVESIGGLDIGTREHDQAVDEGRRMAMRASSLRAQLIRLRPREGEEEFINYGAACLQALARTKCWVRGRPPLLFRASSCTAHDEIAVIADLRHHLVRMIERLANKRNSKARKDIRMWAKSADDRTAHRATKTCDAVFTKTASATKSHAGETTCQAAADAGLAEWSCAWRGLDTDGTDEVDTIVNTIYDATCIEHDAGVIVLPPHGAPTKFDIGPPASAGQRGLVPISCGHRTSAFYPEMRGVPSPTSLRFSRPCGGGPTCSALSLRLPWRRNQADLA